MPNTAPPYTFGGITRPALIFDNAGNIILTPEAAAFAAAYGTKALYVGLPANTPYPPVAATLSAPLDNNGGINSVLENAAVGSQTGITVQANNNGGPPITYSLTDSAGGRFQINATTGVVTVAAALDFETAPSQAYNITVQANDGIFSTSQTFTIGVGNVNEAPAGTSNTVTASEDTNRVFTSADFGFTDPSDSILPNALAAVRITTLPAAGTLLNNGVAVAAGSFISVADINAGHLVFVPAANASGAGYASFTFQVRDNGGTANGGVDTDQSPNTMTINVTAVNDAPTATGLTQSLVINEDAAATPLFPVDPVVADIDSATVTAKLTLNASAGVLVGAGAGVLSGGVLTYTITGTAAAVNAALGAVTYDSAANFHGTASVGITVTDGSSGPQGTNPTGTVSITVNSVNDAPAGTNNIVTASEDTNRVFTSADFGFSDTSDSPANTLAAVVITTLPAAGTLLNNGVPVVAGAAVTAAAIAAGQLVFVPAANASGVGYASFTFQVRDNGGTASGGVDTDASANTMTINVTAVNDAPTATGLTQSLVLNEDAAATPLFSVAPAVADIDSGTVTATLTLNASAGVLVGAGAGVLNAGVLTYTITGSPAAVNTALAAVTYDSAANFHGTANVGIAVTDGANGPQGTNPTGTVSITVNSVNDAPAGADNTVTTNEDTNRVFTSADFGFSDTSDNPANTLAAVIITAVPAAGTLLNNGVAVNPGDSVSAAAIAAGQLVFVPAANANGAGYASFTFQVRDTGGTANGGVDTDASANTMTVNVTAVNDAPVNSVPGAQTINEDGTVTFSTGNGNAISISDVDIGAGSVSVTLLVQHGTLSLGSTAGLSGVINNASVVVFSGSLANVNAALQGLTYTPTANYNGPDALVVDIGDNGNTGATFNALFDHDSIPINVNAVNDAPTATNLTQSLTIAEDDAATTLFTAAPVVADVDSANVTATLTLNATAGVLNGAGAGVLNAGILTYTITGTAAAVNAALAAVTYDSANNFNGAASVGVTIDDSANGPQGTNPTGNISITVTAVNDAPTATNLTQSLVISEDDAATTLFTLSPVVSDIDSANVTATLTLDAAAGVLTGAGAGVLNSGVLTYTIAGTPAAVSAALASVAFDSAPDFNGITDVGITISDGATGPQGSNPIGTGTVTINAVNDAPTATNLTQSLSVGEDGAPATLFTLAPVVADVDSSNVTAKLTLNASAGVLAGAGTGVLNAGVLTYTITGTAADVNSALAAVTYDSADNFNGAASVGITIDDGASGPQGTNPTGTISITVNAVNDAPTATNVFQSLVIDEDAAATTLFTAPPVIADIDSTNVTATLTLDAAAGALNGAGAGVLNAGILTYTITGTPAAVNAALAAVTYDSAPDFNGGTSVGFTVSDGASGPQGTNPTGSIGITVNPVNDAPTLTATAVNPAYAPGVNLFSGVSASTVESGQTITQVVLTVSNVLGNDETLRIDGDTVALINGTVSGAPTAALGVSYTVAVSGNTATITITSPGLSGAQTGNLVDGLSYTNATVDPGELPRVVTIVSLTDDGGTLLGGSDTGTPGIASTVNFNVAPTINVDNTVNYVENDAATQIDSSISISDPDDTHMESATVAITTGFAVGQDVLTFINTANITGNLVGNTLTATGHATLAEYETFLESVRYQNTSNDPSVSDRIVTYTVNDGSVDSVSDTATIHVAARNDQPTLTATAVNPGFTENGAPVDLFSSPVVSTVEAGQTLQEIVITVTNVAGSGATESLLIDGTTVELSNGNNETTATNSMTVSVTLAGGTATVTVQRASGLTDAAMATLVDNLAYGNTSDDPGSANRVVTVTGLRDDGLNGGGNDNNNDALAVSSTVTVTPVNDEPTLTATANGGGAVTFTETSLPAFAGSGPVDLFSSPSTSTVEAGQTIAQVVLSVTNVADTTEYLTIGATAVDLVNGNSEAVVVGGAAGTATVSVVAGVATITVTPTTTFTTAQVNALVDSLAYNNDDNTPTATTHTISVTSLTDSGANGGGNDNTGSPSVSTVVTVVATNDGPVAVNDTFTGVNGAITNTTLVVDGPTAGTADPAGVQKVITGNILANDADADGGPLSVVAGTFTTAQGGSVTLSTDGGFVYVPKPNTDGTVDTNDSFTYTVTDGNSAGQNGTATATVTINFVPNSTIWYVDASYDGSNGASDGSSFRPFTDFTQLNGAGGAGDVDSAGDTIFVADGTYTGNLELEANQKLFGERHGLEAPDGGGAAGVTTLVAANAGAGLTQINGTITAASNNSIQAISWGNSSGVSLTGSNVGALHVNDENAASAGSINNATSAAVSIAGSTAGMNLQFTSVSSGAGASGITLTNTLGTFNASGGTLSGHTSSEISISGGNTNFTYGGTVGNGSGDSVQINNRVGGTVTLSGNINDTNDTGGGIGISGNNNTTINFTGATKTLNTGIGDGVSMTNNTGTSNVNFTGGGLDIDTTNGTGFQATVAGTYTVTGTGNSITTNGNGAALNLNTVIVGVNGITFDSTSSTNSTGTAVAISSVTGGAIALGTGSISGSDGDAFRVGDGAGTAGTGGTSAITYAGSISKTDGSGQAVDIQDRGATAGNITLSGNITHTLAANTGILLDDNLGGTVTFSGSSKSITSGTATAVNVTDNTGATIAFTNGGLVINTTAGNGFNATGVTAPATTGGTVTVEGGGNTITSTTGIALNVVHTTIGANGLTFQSISANGGANGIVLNDTGTSGGLTVTGDGGSTNNGSGGTIQNTSGAGISLTNTQNVAFDQQNISGTGGSGVNGTGVTNFSYTNGTITNAGDAVVGGGQSAHDSAISFNGTNTGVGNNIAGTLTVTGNTIINAFYAGLNVESDAGTVTSANISNNIITNPGFSGINFSTTGTATTAFSLNDADINNNNISGSGGNGIQISIGNGNGAAAGAAAVAHAGFVTIDGAGRPISDPSHIISITNNLITLDSGGTQAITVANTSASAAARTQTNFEILNNGTVANPLGSSAIGTVILIGNNGYSDMAGLVDNNRIDASHSPDLGNGNGIAGGNGVGGAGAAWTPRLNLTVSNNNIKDTDGSGILLVNRSTNGEAYLKVNDNTVTTPLSQPGGSAEYGIRIDAGNATAGEDSEVYLNIFGNISSGHDGATGIGVRKDGLVATTNDFGIFDAAGGPTLATNPTDAQVTAFLALLNPGSVGGVTDIASGQNNFTRDTTLAPALNAAAGGVQASSPTPGATLLSQAQLDSVVEAAIAQWEHAGASENQLAALRATVVSVGGLTGDAIGEQTPGHIIIDGDAAGHGWFVDSTPGDSSEFARIANAAGTDRFTDPSNAAAGHLDLLTAVVHEMGHVLGLVHNTDGGDVMADQLVDGERRLPDVADVAQANAGPVQAQANGQAPLMPVVRGTAGNDTIDAGSGGKILVGEAGADHFVFTSVPASTSITHVADYSFAQGDSFDFSALTSQFHYSDVSDATLVRVVQDPGGSFATLQINTNAKMRDYGAQWTNVAQIDGAHAGDDVSVLIDSHGAAHLAHLHVGLLA